MSEDVPTFGRENLEPKDQPTWDYWARLYADHWLASPLDRRLAEPGKPCPRCGGVGSGCRCEPEST
jgi:hypothetical protein